MLKCGFFLVLAKTLEIKAWREYEFEFSRLPIAITTGANIRIRKVNNKNRQKFQLQKPENFRNVICESLCKCNEINEDSKNLYLVVRPKMIVRSRTKQIIFMNHDDWKKYFFELELNL